MAKYRKKPVIIEAFQYDGDLSDRDGLYYVPEWAKRAYKEGILFFSTLKDRDKEYPGQLFVKSLEGNMVVNVGDYVIQGVQGELYPCKADIFNETYDEVN